ncbi:MULTISPECIES: methionyl-tRNA formyltransferase [unclassified Nocardioides]|uniref:methionyl-tRNA formyltransferase n=1 Tax=unclassified Nocardioides TaxID=2615069 RepID=UPI0006FB0459|nr:MULTISPECIES: methionyl-tRNA formyltransferase [unclassified Nocardioides]KRA32703.1 methionyl-tRNA formyltransferase [Nocardioides sp. Root614]KRA89355.1 methionyl-tRNA formyltransferase [Nocardioides sp. Root682]
MRVVFAGTPEVAVPALDAIAASPHELVGVITRPDAPSGRGRKLTPSPVGLRAEELGVPVLKPTHPRDPEFQAALKALEPDCCPVVAYGALIPRSALDIPKHGWVNLHFSVLPAWRGAAPVQHSIWAGDEYTGATTFQIVEALDAGPMFGVMTERIKPTDTAGDLLERLAEGGSSLLVATLDGIADGALEARTQPLEGVTLAPKITVDDARISWTDPAVGIDRLIRACTPGPGAWTTLDGERVKVGPVSLEEDAPALAPGAISVGKNHVLVGTATGAVRLGEVKAFGKKQMAAADWARGVRLPETATFE